MTNESAAKAIDRRHYFAGAYSVSRSREPITA